MRKIRNTMPFLHALLLSALLLAGCVREEFRVQALWQKESLHE